MTTLTKENEKYFEGLKKDLNEREQMFNYNIVHCMNFKPSNYWVSMNLNPNALEGLMVYIEQEAFEIGQLCGGYALTEQEVMEVVNEFYADVTILSERPRGKCHEIDLFCNWENLTSHPFDDGMPELYREGLFDYLEDMSIRNNWSRNEQ